MKTPNFQTTRTAGGLPAAQVAWICLFLVLAVLAVFGQTAHFEFVDYDDGPNVYENPVVQQGLSAQAVGWAFAHTQLANWVPLTALSHMLDCQVFGLRAGGHHLVNVLWHAANAVLLFLVLRQMTGSLWRSAFVAALFAVHPLRAESVAWVSERKDVLSGFFFILAIGAYVRQVRQPTRAGPFGLNLNPNPNLNLFPRSFPSGPNVVFLLFALGLLAKSMVATLPFVLLVLDFWPLGRMRGMQNASSFAKPTEDKEGPAMECGGLPPLSFVKPTEDKESAEQEPPSLPFWALVKEKIPLLALSAASCVATALVPGLLVTNGQRLPFLERLGNALVSYVVYLGQMIFPAGLAAPYPYPPTGQPMWKAGLALVLLAGITWFVLAWRKKRPCLLAGWLWYLGMLLPVIGLIQISPDAAHADRYTYLPGIGLALGATWAAADWSAGWKLGRVAVGGLMIGAIGALMVCAHIQTSYWRDNESLWKRALACASGSYLAHFNMGNALVKRGQLDDAIVQFQKAVEIRPALPQPHYNLANALFKQDKLDEAIAHYRASLAIQPENAEALNNLGNALATKGDDEAAVAQYEKALAIQPGYSDALYDLGHVLLKQGKLDRAVSQFRKLVEIRPHDAEAQNSLGEALLLKGDSDGAVACFDKAATLSPDAVANWCKLGDSYLQKEYWEVAITCYQRALNINPRSADAGASLGMAFYKKGEAREAIASWLRALAIYPDQLSVLNNLAWLLATASDTPLRDGLKAVALATRANELSGGGNPVILHTLAVAYAAEASYGRAAETARRALKLAVEQKKDALAATLQNEIERYEANAPPRNPPR